MSHTDQGPHVVTSPNGYNLRTSHGAIVGAVATKWGYVDCYSHGSFTSVAIILNRKRYLRTFKRSFTKRGLVTKAAAFAEEVAVESAVLAKLNKEAE